MNWVLVLAETGAAAVAGRSTPESTLVAPQDDSTAGLACDAKRPVVVTPGRR